MKSNGRSTWVRIGIVVLMLGCGSAVPAYGFASGTGEPNNPYQIATAADLLSIGSDPNLWTKHFLLLNDLDLDPNLPGGRVFDDALIGRDTYANINVHSSGFTGLFDGQGHTIRHLCLSGKDGYDAGLFGICSGLVKDLHLGDVRVSGAPCGALAGLVDHGMVLRCSVTGRVMGSQKVGGLVGEAWSGMILRCESQADVTGTSPVGGLVGHSFDNAQIVESRTSGAVTGVKWVGGLIGRGDNTMVFRCRAACGVTATGTAGGLMGYAFGRVSVFDSYARGSIAGSVVGGLIGDASISYLGIRTLNSYAACEMLGLQNGKKDPMVGGLFGTAKQGPCEGLVVSACFWDTELSKVLIGTGSEPADYGTGLDTKQMRQATPFEQAGWDFGYAWAMPTGDYPVLQWEMTQDKND